MIEVKDITKYFDTFKALDNCCINVKKGSIYGLVGENGAGKTTLIKHLTGVYKQNSGIIRIDQQPVFENNNIKQRIAYIPDELYFYGGYSIKDMSKLYSRIYSNWSQERYEKLKKVFPIDEKKKVNRLSKGMKKQVAFWLAVSIKPDIMILDEPMDGLDPVMRKKVTNLIIQDVAEREMTVLISSHNLRELEDICDSIAIMHKGKIILQRELEDLKTDVQKVQIAFNKEIEEDFMKTLNVLSKEKVGSVYNLIVRGNVEETIKICQKCSPVVLDLLPLTLEEIFIYEMGGLGYEVDNILL